MSMVPKKGVCTSLVEKMSSSFLRQLLKTQRGSLSQTKQIHAQFITHDVSSLSCTLLNILIQSYSKHSYNKINHSLLLFKHILSCIKPQNAINLPDKFTFTFLISSCSRHYLFETGESCHSQSIKTGFYLDMNVANALINLYSVFAEMTCANKVFNEMSVRDVVSWTTLIKGYANSKHINVARTLFDEMPVRNVVSWTVMIVGYVNTEMFSDALELFNAMLKEPKEIPNEAILVCVLTACAHLGALDQGKWIHAYVDKIKQGKSPNVVNSLINMYSKCGQIESAKHVFYDCSIRDGMTWTSMINGFALHGLGEEALKLFNLMVAEGINPDSISILGVLNACSHSGLVEEGSALFYNMTWLWNVKPEIKHYGCLIDLLGRNGQVEKAVAIVLKMPIQPDIVIWRSLISACRTHRKVELSERIVNYISSLDLSSEGGGHVLLSNLYATTGKWDEVAKVRDKMGTETKRSSPGCSWIEIDGVVHEFLVADKLHPQINEIRNKLSEVIREVSMKGGYIANAKNVLFDLSDEDRDQAMYLHSEKLAIAFGLMSLESCCSIRIVKNLRICEDCHSLMKAISFVFGREIVIRDRSRFHTFINGKCSCNDYW